MDYREQRRQRKAPEPQNQQLKRAERKALKLLERMDRTEAQLREKLLAAEFDSETVEAAIDYVKSFGYLDDERYVRNYIEYRKDQKSRLQLVQELQYRKGVPEELIRKVYEELEPVDEKLLIRRYLEKKGYDPESWDERRKQKAAAALMRKGFRTGDILHVLKEEWKNPQSAPSGELF